MRLAGTLAYLGGCWHKTHSLPPNGAKITDRD
jgi:hypothetical protein